MEKIIAACGIVCTECPAYIATKNDDEELRKKTAAEWSKMFGADLSAKDIYCDGCMEKGERYFSHCHECEIRKCVIEKHLPNCAYCNEYPCDKITEFFGFVPDAKKVLDAIKKTL